MKFSDRLGITSLIPLQIDSMNEALRVSIWNFLLPILKIKNMGGPWQYSLQNLAENFFKFPIQKVPGDFPSDGENWFQQRYDNLKWHEVYNLLEFFVEFGEALSGGQYKRQKIEELANEVLERECSGYRFIKGQLAPITNETELRSIGDAIAVAKSAGFGGVLEHLETSVQLLSKRPEPDYRNATKEAISAVESAAKRISGVESGGLAAMKDGFLKLYGYSSDEDGIRHAILEEAKVGFEEAKFMLVACSAFVNFLVSKAEAAGLLKGDGPQR